ncbi:GNAT family N-acetyltransferase [Dongia deserti]|uniref:GNAT family N-acetyltransferase n=1 Tax=Dongia deserti TaxID=2268030 RepID=UPI0013C4CA37|nr:GNAT family N-acetyltransferase [Dongia deserti]
MPESSHSASWVNRAPSITIEEAFAYCRSHPVAGIDLERFLGIFTTDAHRIVDARDVGLVGIIMDRLTIVDGAKPFEWIGGDVEKIDATTFPIVVERLRRTARELGIPSIDLALSAHWSNVRDLLAREGAHPQFVDLELTHADCNWGPDRPLPEGWRWALVTPDREPAYISLLNCGMGPMPGVYVPPEAEALASMRTTADGTKLLLDAQGQAQAMIRCKLANRYLHLICCASEMRGRGLGRLALDEVRRMLGPGPLHLTVVKQNEHAHGFYLHMGFVETEQIEIWRLPIVP